MAGPFRDWPRSLLPASFRGTSFFVEKDTVSTGRRLVVHEFPHRDTPYVEDMGRDANKISVTAYVLGNDADGQERALRSACESGGAARLSLPLGRFEAHCQTCKRDFAKDKLGYVAFALEFVREGSAAGPLPVAFLAHMVSSTAAEALTPLSALFIALYRGLGVAGFVADAAAMRIGDIAATLDVASRDADIAVSALPDLRQRVADLFTGAEALAAVGDTADRIERSAFLARAETALAAPVVTSVFSLVRDIAAAAPPASARRIALSLAPFGTDETLPAPTTPSRRMEAANRAALDRLVRIGALSALAEATARSPFADRRAALAARADLVEAFDGELERLSADRAADLYTAMDLLRGRVLDLLQRRIADLAPVIAVSAPETMPALWWAWRLYADPGRAGEIVARNRVRHGTFMPTEFEALAR